MPKLPPKVYIFLIGVVSIGWIANIAVSIISYFTGGNYHSDIGVNALLAGIVGALFGFGGWRSKNGPDNHDKSGEK